MLHIRHFSCLPCPLLLEYIGNYALLSVSIATTRNERQREPCRESVCMFASDRPSTRVRLCTNCPSHRSRCFDFDACIAPSLYASNHLLASWEPLQSQLALQIYPSFLYLPVHHLSSPQLSSTFSVNGNKQKQEHPAHGICLAPPPTANWINTTVTTDFFGFPLGTYTRAVLHILYTLISSLPAGCNRYCSTTQGSRLDNCIH
jgi:hypothetical protein